MRIRCINVFKKEFAATFKMLPLLIGGLVTPLFIYFTLSMSMGQYDIKIGNYALTQYIVSGVILFQLVYSTFYQSSYNTYYSFNITQTMDELMTSPLSSSDILIGKVINTTVISIIISAPVLIILMLVSKINFSIVFFMVSIGYLFMVALISSLLGNLLGILVKSEFTLINIANALVIPIVFLSDSFTNLSDKFNIIKCVIYLSPIKVANDAIRSAILNREIKYIDVILLVLYVIITYFITYKIYDDKSRE